MMAPAARFFIPSGEGNRIRCLLCPRGCEIAPGERGRCKVRENRDGRGALPFYGFITAMAEDPIEKKPLYHFRPGSAILSVGFAGCNCSCPFCQNHHISQTTDAAGREYSPEALIAIARRGNFRHIAYTYSEPLVHIEYLLDCMACSRDAGITSALVSNGCVTEKSAAAVLPLTGAANIDLKSFSEKTYADYLGGNLGAVCAFIRAAYESGVHLEVTTLIVPGLNDRMEELERAAAFLADISPDIPWHLSAYHPAYRWKSPATALESLREIAGMARNTLRFVYIGNTVEHTNTCCPSCGETLIRRQGYRISTGKLAVKLEDGRAICRCGACGHPVPIVMDI